MEARAEPTNQTSLPVVRQLRVGTARIWC